MHTGGIPRRQEERNGAGKRSRKDGNDGLMGQKLAGVLTSGTDVANSGTNKPRGNKMETQPAPSGAISGNAQPDVTKPGEQKAENQQVSENKVDAVANKKKPSGTKNGERQTKKKPASSRGDNNRISGPTDMQNNKQKTDSTNTFANTSAAHGARPECNNAVDDATDSATHGDAHGAHVTPPMQTSACASCMLMDTEMTRRLTQQAAAQTQQVLQQEQLILQMRQQMMEQAHIIKRLEEQQMRMSAAGRSGQHDHYSRNEQPTFVHASTPTRPSSSSAAPTTAAQNTPDVRAGQSVEKQHLPINPHMQPAEQAHLQHGTPWQHPVNQVPPPLQAPQMQVCPQVFPQGLMTLPVMEPGGGSVLNPHQVADPAMHQNQAGTMQMFARLEFARSAAERAEHERQHRLRESTYRMLFGLPW